MIEKNYRCDLCRDSKPLDELIGLYWKEHRPGGAPKGWERRPANQVERHLCGVCAESIVSMVTPSVPADPS